MILNGNNIKLHVARSVSHINIVKTDGGHMRTSFFAIFELLVVIGLVYCVYLLVKKTGGACGCGKGKDEKKDDTKQGGTNVE